MSGFNSTTVSNNALITSLRTQMVPVQSYDGHVLVSSNGLLLSPAETNNTLNTIILNQATSYNQGIFQYNRIVFYNGVYQNQQAYINSLRTRDS